MKNKGASKQQTIIAPQKGSQEIALNSDADLIIYGGAAGSGKSHLLLMHSLKNVHDPNFNCVYFRKNSVQLLGQGGLYNEYQKITKPFNPSTRIKPNILFRFPSGASSSFMHLQHEDDKYAHQGLQYTGVYFDKLLSP